jgi:hypothetical protein
MTLGTVLCMARVFQKACVRRCKNEASNIPYIQTATTFYTHGRLHAKDGLDALSHPPNVQETHSTLGWREKNDPKYRV